MNNQTEIKMVMMPEDLVKQIQENNRILSDLNLKVNTILNKQIKPMTAQDAAEYLGVSYQHLIRNLKHEIPHSQRGRKVTFLMKDLDEFRRKNTK